MKHRTSTNDNRGKHPYLIAHNWKPGGQCCFWDALRERYPDYCEQQDKRIEAIQTRSKENLITNNRSER